MKPATIVLANLAATLFLTGLAWFLQTVQLPLMVLVARPEFAQYAKTQRVRNTALMAPAMLIELATAAVLALYAFAVDDFAVHLYLMCGAALVAMIWAVTFAFIVPANSRLVKGYDGAALRSLIRSNWLRTICWSSRAVIMIQVARAAVLNPEALRLVNGSN